MGQNPRNKPQSGRVTARQVADASGYSVPAVYHAVRGNGNLASHTRRQILSVAHEMGFRVNAAAQATRAGRFNALALLTSVDPRRSFLPCSLMSGMQAAARCRGQRLMLAELEDDFLTDADYMPRILTEWSADGVLVDYHSEVPDRFRQLLKSTATPHVWVNDKRAHDCVHPNDVDTGRRATEVLIEAGHRRIAFVNHSGWGHYSAVDRQAGYEQAMATAGLPPLVWAPAEPDLIPQDDRFVACRQWLSAFQPSAIVSYANYSAAPLLTAAFSLGWSVPRDLSLVTVDKQPFTLMGLRVTTMKIDLERVGRRAVAMLLDKIDAPARAMGAEAVACIECPGVTVAHPAA